MRKSHLLRLKQLGEVEKIGRKGKGKEVRPEKKGKRDLNINPKQLKRVHMCHFPNLLQSISNAYPFSYQLILYALTLYQLRFHVDQQSTEVCQPYQMTAFWLTRFKTFLVNKQVFSSFQSF